MPVSATLLVFIGRGQANLFAAVNVAVIVTALMLRIAAQIVTCLLLISLGTSSLFAQSKTVNSFDELRSVVMPGDEIRVTDRNGKSVSGRLDGVSGDSISLRTKQTIVQVRQMDVSEISRRKGDSVLNGSLIGFGAGLAAGIVVTSVATGGGGCNLSNFCTLTIALSTAAGTGIGLGLDASKGKREILYTPSGTAGRHGIQFAPLVSRQGFGIALTARF